VGIAAIADIARNRETETYANLGCPGMNGEGEGEEEIAKIAGIAKNW